MPKERYSALKKEKTLARVTTKMNPWDITLYEKASHKKANTVRLYLYTIQKVTKLIETKEDSGCQGLGEGEMGVVQWVYGFRVCKMKKFCVLYNRGIY